MSAPLPPAEPAPANGGLVVFFVQSEIIEPTRIAGHLASLPHVRRLLAALPEGDRVAVVSFDSHLKLWQDFTGDRAAVERALAGAIRFGGEPPDGPAPDADNADDAEVSLAAGLDPAAMRRAANPERGLQLTAEALEPLDGYKTMIFVGWGLGRWSTTLGLRMRPAYFPAVRALFAARVTVFSIDVTTVPGHGLAAGLAAVAADTGGAYASTAEFPAQVIQRLGRALGGHYVLSFDSTDLVRGGRLHVELREPARGRVLVRPLVIEKDLRSTEEED